MHVRTQDPEMQEPAKALATGAIIGSGFWLFGAPFLSGLGISIGAFLLLGGWKFMKQLQTFPRDFRYLGRISRKHCRNNMIFKAI